VNEVADTPPEESAVLVPALGVGQLVRDLRMQYTPSARAGVPPHVTLMIPFVPPRDLTDAANDALTTLMSRTRAFDFSLTQVSQFDAGVVYLEPEPAEPFARLTRQISRQFGVRLYGGDFGDKPVVHMTVAILESAAIRQQVVTQLSDVVPIDIKAEEAWLMVGGNASIWNVVRKMPFRD
jgi:2'-5' RNA ligase